MFMLPDSPNRFLTAPVRAARSPRRHSHSVSCQEPVRRSLGPPGDTHTRYPVRNLSGGRSDLQDLQDLQDHQDLQDQDHQDHQDH